jgi:hypothetical protein
MNTLMPDLYTLHPDGRYRKYPLVGNGELGPETPRPTGGLMDAAVRVYFWVVSQGWAVTVQAKPGRPEGERFTCEVSELTDGTPLPRGLGYVCGYGWTAEHAVADAAHKIATEVLTEDTAEDRALDAIIALAMTTSPDEKEAHGTLNS